MVSFSLEEVEQVRAKLPHPLDFTQKVSEHIISSVNVPNGHKRFKDVRKISIGVDKKDVLHRRIKQKSAFYNCLVLMIRMRKEPTQAFKEYHVKVFNTGKIGIPGIQDNDTFFLLLKETVAILQPFCKKESLGYIEQTLETILINTNFNCGYYINRELLYDILVRKYNIQAGYEPCSYPGIQCTFYYDPLRKDFQPGYIIDPKRHQPQQQQRKKKRLASEMEGDCSDDNDRDSSTSVKEVSFMIFRTGSVLISGKHHHKCQENILGVVYEFLKRVFQQEYFSIRQLNVASSEMKKPLAKKNKKRFVACLPTI